MVPLSRLHIAAEEHLDDAIPLDFLQHHSKAQFSTITNIWHITYMDNAKQQAQMIANLTGDAFQRV